MGVDEDDRSTGSAASAHNEVNGPAGAVVQAGSISGDVVIGAKPGPGRVSWSQLDEWAEGLARAVQAFWHAEEANRQIHDPVALPVRWQAARDTLRDQWSNIRRLPAQAGRAEPLSLAGQLEHIAEVYGRIPSQRLVVLGPAGAGKTVLAGRLALELLTTRRVGDPVPVLVNLAAWNPTTTSLHTFLVEQLVRDHPALSADAGAGDAASQAAALVAGERILPILDGFDEIESGLHERALHHLNSTTESPLVLTSREDEYAAAVQGVDVVTAAAVVTLEDLSLRDLAAYLPRTVAGFRTGMWDAVLGRLETQSPAPEEARLHRVLTNPLMVFLARTAYSDTPGQDPTELFDADRFPSEQTLQQHLLAKFLPAVYPTSQDRAIGDRTRRGWGAGQAGRYLTYLADHLHRADTRDLAWWRLRDTIPRTRRTLILAATDALIAMLTLGTLLGGSNGVASTLTLGLVTLLPSGLTMAITTGLTNRRLPRLLRSKATLALGTALITGITTSGLMAVFTSTLADVSGFGILYGTAGGVAVWTVGLRTAGPQPARTRLQIRGRIRILTTRFTAGFALGFALGIAAGFVYSPDGSGIPAAGLLLGLMIGLVATLAYGFDAPLNVEEMASAPESLARDRGNSIRKVLAAILLIGCPSALLGGLTYVLTDGFMNPPTGTAALTDAVTDGLTSTLTNGLTYGLGAGLLAGWLSVRVTDAWFFWLVLVRGWLPLTGRLPWRVQAFLTDAHRRGVLRQAGAVYQFRHAALQDHLTTEAPTSRCGARYEGTTWRHK